jgi:hypothetical protein
MFMGRKILAFTIGSAILGSPFLGDLAEGKPKRTRHRHIVRKPVGCPIHRTAEGEPVDCRGWRYRAGVGWDNTCINLDYLPSMYACSSNDRR